MRRSRRREVVWAVVPDCSRGSWPERVRSGEADDSGSEDGNMGQRINKIDFRNQKTLKYILNTTVNKLATPGARASAALVLI